MAELDHIRQIRHHITVGDTYLHDAILLAERGSELATAILQARAELLAAMRLTAPTKRPAERAGNGSEATQ